MLSRRISLGLFTQSLPSLKNFNAFFKIWDKFIPHSTAVKYFVDHYFVGYNCDLLCAWTLTWHTATCVLFATVTSLNVPFLDSRQQYNTTSPARAILHEQRLFQTDFQPVLPPPTKLRIVRSLRVHAGNFENRVGREIILSSLVFLSQGSIHRVGCPEWLHARKAFMRECLGPGSSCIIPDFCSVLSRVRNCQQILIKFPSIKFHENPFNDSGVFPCAKTDSQTWRS
jgi:hypothetical protein